MPLKGFKGFNRRKSFGNALDEPFLEPPPPVSSFRVLERPHEPSKSFDGGHNLARAAAGARPVSQGNDLDILGRYGPGNRVSHITQNSASSVGPYQSSSSARSTSTLPSAPSLEQAQDDSAVPVRATMPLPHTNTAPPGMFRAALGLRKSTLPQPVTTSVHFPQHQHDDYSDIPGIHPRPRQRTATGTSLGNGDALNAPGFLVTDLGLKSEDDNDDFSNMFSNLSTDPRTSSKEVVSDPKIEDPIRPKFTRAANSLPVSPAPPSVGSTASQDDVMGSTSRIEALAARRRPSPGPYAGLSTGIRTAYHRGTPSPGSSVPSYPSRPASGILERSLVPKTRTPSPANALMANESPQLYPDDDMALAMQYVEQAEPSPLLGGFPPQVKPSEDDERNDSHAKPLLPSQMQPIASKVEAETSFQVAPATDDADTNSILMTPKLAEAWVEPEDSVDDDASLQEIALYADRLEEEQPVAPPPRQKPVTTGKVMTPAQFERYKKEQERRQLVEGSDSEEEKEESDKEDDDAEDERNREMAKHRRKQEADLAVYRQKMMKITGDSSSQRPVSKDPNGLFSGIPTFSFGETVGGSGTNSEEEDEDVPLGILAAHGFPSKNRAPSHMDAASRPSVQYKSETYPAPPRPASNISLSAETAEKGKPLPAFAKNLPKDPFYGASLVTPADRQSLAFGSGASVHGGSQAAAPSAAPQGGLVGVIAKEERARALRRGNTNMVDFEASNAASGLGAPLGAPPGLPPAMSAEQHAQMQLTQQMHQMMQMQMQWMQQMMQMQQDMGHAAPPMPPMPGMAGMPGMPGMSGMPPMPAASRPVSTYPAAANRTASTYGAVSGGGPRQSTQRPMPHATQSTPNLLVPGAGLSTAYATSLAPSERSTVGQPSRYRPVSSTVDVSADRQQQQQQQQQRSSTLHARDRSVENGYSTNGGAGSTSTSPKAHSPLRESRSGGGGGGTSPGPNGAAGTNPRATLQAVPRAMGQRGQRGKGGGSDNDTEDDDDAAGWAAMQAARQRQRGTWKGRTDSRLGHAPEDEGLEGLVGVMHYPIE